MPSQGLLCDAHGSVCECDPAPWPQIRHALQGCAHLPDAWRVQHHTLCSIHISWDAWHPRHMALQLHVRAQTPVLLQLMLAVAPTKNWAIGAICVGMFGNVIFPAIATIKSNNVAASEQVCQPCL